MSLLRLALTDFRSYASSEISPLPGFVLLYGENGAGKTNILEAVSLLTPGRGLRGAALSEMARQGGNGAFAVAAKLHPFVPSPSTPPAASLRTSYVEGRVSTALDTNGIVLGTGTLPSAPERREVRINGAPAAVNSLSEWLSVLWLTPAMDRLFSGSAGDRRRFLDRLVLALEPSHAHHASRYEAAMRARNKLLTDEAWDEAWLASLELAMAEHGTAIGAARERTIALLGERLDSAPDDQFARASISLEGWAGGDLTALLRASRQRDAGAGRATEGPHRQDLVVTHRAKQMPASRSSTGEQKALLLGLVLAHAELVADRRGEPPILLLDEVAAHLDPKRRAALFERLEGHGQVWMTATEATLFEGIGVASRFRIEPGIVYPE